MVVVFLHTVACPADGMTQSYALHEPLATCYEMNSVGSVWTTARDVCWGRQGTLAVLDTQDKLDFLLSFFRAGQSSVTGAPHKRLMF